MRTPLASQFPQHARHFLVQLEMLIPRPLRVHLTRAGIGGRPASTHLLDDVPRVGHV